MAVTTKSGAFRAADEPLLAGNPAAFIIKTGRIGAFAKTHQGEDIDLDVRRANFVQGERKSLLDDGDVMYLSGTASSTVEDRTNDILDSRCQATMAEQSRGMTLFLNHQYDVPEDILGVCAQSSLVMTHDTKRGECLDFNIVARVDPDNPRAVKCWRHVQSGTQLGWSIGGRFLDVTIRDADDWNSGLIVSDIELLEISLVGVPANPRTYTRFVSEMTKGFKENLTVAAATIGDQLDARKNMRSVGNYVCKSLLGGIRPEDIRLDHSTLTVTPAQYDAFPVKGTGTREDANDDPERLTVPENPNATPTNDRPVPAQDSPTAQMATQLVGPPNGDEPPAVPQVGSPKVTGAQPGSPQPQESNPVSPSNAAPYPARFHGDEANDGHQGGPEDNLLGRPAQHAQQGKEDAPSGAEASSVAVDPVAKPEKSGDVKPPKPAQAEAGSPGAKSVKDIEDVILMLKDVLAEGADSDTTAAVLTDGQGGLRRKALRAMRHIKKAVSPGMHNESNAHLRVAHKSLVSMMGDYALDPDVMLDEVPAGNTYALPDMQTKAVELDATITAKKAAVASLDTELEKKNSEVKDLEKKLADLRATPIGRRSANPSGSYLLQESEPTVSADMYYRPDYEQTKSINEAVMRPGTEARDRA